MWAGEAIARARSLVDKGGQYVLGTGDYRPKAAADLPWTYRDGKLGSDCAGFAICWAWKLVRHRPGFNVGSWASVSDDINCNSCLEDGSHKQELFETVPVGGCVRPGDLLLYPTVRIKKDGTKGNGKTHVFIGHVGLIETVPLTFKYGDWGGLSVIQCKGPNGRKPAVVRTDGGIWVKRDANWSKPEHVSRVVRVKEST